MMRIALIVEGYDPYIRDELSSWLQMLVSSLPEYQFILYSIAAEEQDRVILRDKLPSNVVEIKEVFLDRIKQLKGVHGKKYRLTSREIHNMVGLLTGSHVEWKDLVETIHRLKMDSVMDFLMSRDFERILNATYREGQGMLPFTDFFRMLRSMLLPLFYLWKQDIPRADIYHSLTTGYAGAVGGLASYLYNRPLLVTELGIYSREREEEIIQDASVKECFKDHWFSFYYGLAQFVYQRADQIITLFQKNKEIQLELGCPENKISIVPQGVSVEDYSTLPEVAKEDDYVNIGAMVRIVPEKDIITMLKSFFLVKSKLPQTRFYILGATDENEEYFAECQRIAENMGLEDLFCAGKFAKKEFMGKMDILVLTSLNEGQPLAMLEGMAAKRPFVATDVGGCKELLYGNNDEFGPAGLIVTVMDYEAVAGALIKLAASEQMRKSMGENGYRRVKNTYGQENFAGFYRRVYDRYKWNASVINKRRNAK